MFRDVSSLHYSSEGVDDLACCLGPDERLGVRVPGFDPVAEVFLESLGAAAIGALQAVASDLGEEPFDLVDPG